MINRLFAALLLTTLSALVMPALAAEEAACLECHEPAEDWQGLTAEEIMVQARDPANKRHADNAALSDDQLKAIITVLVQAPVPAP